MKNKWILLLTILCIVVTLGISASATTVAYISHNKGSDTNDGLSDATPKSGFGSTTGSGVVGILAKGGTLVVCEKMYLGSNYTWQVDGDTVITAVYGGKDYRNPEPAENPASGVFKLKGGITLTVSSNVTMENLILHQNATILVANGATLTIRDTVTTLPGGGKYLNIIVSSGAKAVINGGTYSSIEGNGEIILGDKVKVVGGGNAETEPAERVCTACYVDYDTGNNENDGKSAATALKGYGNGVFERMLVGGTVVVSGKSNIFVSSSATAFAFPVLAKPVVFTSVYDGVDYRESNPNAVFYLAERTDLNIYSDVIFDNILLAGAGVPNTIRVHTGATLTMTDTVEFTSKIGNGKPYAIYLEKGAYAHLSKSAQAMVTVLGEGEVFTYTDGATDALGYVLGTKTMVELTIGSTTAYVNGVAHTLDAAPLNRKNRTMLPVRFLANAFGIADDGIAWDPATRTATISGQDVKISITIGVNSMLVNGKTVALDSPAFIEKDRTYLPVRAIANALGVSDKNIGWTAATNTATLLK